MNRRQFLTAAGGALAVAGSGGVSLADAVTSASAAKPGAAKKSVQPNLLFVFADMLGRNHVGYAGARHARTPHIDAFRGQSVDFVVSITFLRSPVFAILAIGGVFLLLGVVSAHTRKICARLQRRGPGLASFCKRFVS